MGFLDFDTIAAVATPFGTGGVAIVRISGSDSRRILSEVFIPESGICVEDIPTSKLIFGRIKNPKTGKELDTGLVSIAKSPHSYTGEDVAEINCHGGRIITKLVLEAIISAGARHAEAGEFTKRAFINGKLDLTRAEAVIDLIEAKTEKAAEMAFGAMQGALSEAVLGIRQRILELAVYLDALADFPEEVDELGEGELADRISGILHDIKELIKSADTGRIVKEGIATAIVGKPNVGKSSLLNALLGEQRAIVTDVAGTTRDTLEEYINIGGIPIKLIDTAGIRQSGDLVESLGIGRALESIRAADVVLFVTDVSCEWDEQDVCVWEKIKDKRLIIIANKTDLAEDGKFHGRESINKHCGGKHVVIETALIKGKENLTPIIEAINGAVSDFEVDFENNAYVYNERQKNALILAGADMEKAEDALRLGTPQDLLAVHLEGAAEAMGSVVGLTVRDEIVDAIFQNFCVGK